MNRAKIAARVIAATSVLTVAAATGALAYRSVSGAQHAAATTLPPDKPLSSPEPASLRVTRHYVGVFERGVPGTYQPVQRFGRATGTTPGVVVYFSGWHDPFQAAFAATARKHGAVVLVQMLPKGYSMASIAAGRSDAYLRSYARAVRAYGHQVILSFAPEADGTWYPWGHGRTRPRIWVAAWRHVVTVFRKAGAKNATWMWDMNINGASKKTTGPVRDWWPGRKYVTWVGMDGYYVRPGATFASVFGTTLRAVRRLTAKPVMIGEVGIGPVSGQARSLPGLFAGIRRYHLLGLVYFDAPQHGNAYHEDWRLEGHPAALRAFRRGRRSLKG
ncbi:MAG: glycoside hydrolase family 26 protein [Streptosporangiaceae bacterium]